MNSEGSRYSGAKCFDAVAMLSTVCAVRRGRWFDLYNGRSIAALSGVIQESDEMFFLDADGVKRDAELWAELLDNNPEADATLQRLAMQSAIKAGLDDERRRSGCSRARQTTSFGLGEG